MKRLPERGDVVWASMDPAVGREQTKHRPWLVLSERALHRARGLVVAVPLTHTDRGWVTHVNLTPSGDEPTIAMCEHVKSMSTSRIARIEPTPYPSRIVDQVHSVLTLLTEGRQQRRPREARLTAEPHPRTATGSLAVQCVQAETAP